MTEWRQLLRWVFDGPRFEDHGIELSDLREIFVLRDALVETAKQLWRIDNPERERLPKNFEQSLVLKFFEVEEGSAAIPVKYRVDEAEQATFPIMAAPADPDDPMVRLIEARDVVADAIQAANARSPLPSRLPRSVLPKIELIGATLDGVESGRLEVPGRPAARVTSATREFIHAQAMLPWTDSVNLIGVVTAANLKGRATIEIDGAPVEIAFEPVDEKVVTEALYRHEHLRLRVIGRGDFEPPRGRLRRISQVDRIELVDWTSETRRPDEKRIWDVAAEIAAEVSDDVWAELPDDLSTTVDDRMYGEAAEDLPS